MRTLPTPICTLEPQVVSHAREMFAVLGDPAIYQFENAPPVSEQWLRERFEKLETRKSTDGAQRWLNWVVRVPSGELAGYIQATVMQTNVSLVAFVLASKFWRRGIGSSALIAMQQELTNQYGVDTFVAVLKASNFRSSGLLSMLGYTLAGPEDAALFGAKQDEIVMVKSASGAGSSGG